MKLSLILPVYNSRAYLLNNLPAIYKYLKSTGMPFEIMVAEDGSSDVFGKETASFIKKRKEIRFVHSKSRLGRGLAIKRSVKILNGDVIGYMDIDLATGVDNLKTIMELFESEKYDIVVGSRYSKSKNNKRSAKRFVLSALFNSLVKLLFGSRLADHQCGFKFFRKEFIKKYAAAAEDNHWFWDTEIMIIAQKKGMRICELPVSWKEFRKTTVKVACDSLDMFLAVVRLLFRIRKM